MELSIGEILTIMLVIVIFFGPKKIPQIARELGEGVRKMRGAMEDIKSEILQEADNPVSEIKKEIEKVKEAAKEFNPAEMLKEEIEREPDLTYKQKDNPEYEGPVSR